MKHENALFIGGAADGERRDVLSGIPSIDVAVLPKRAAGVPNFSAEPTTMVDFQQQRYTRQRLRSEHADFVVYVADGVDPIKALIEGYRQPK